MQTAPPISSSLAVGCGESLLPSRCCSLQGLLPSITLNYLLTVLCKCWELCNMVPSCDQSKTSNYTPVTKTCTMLDFMSYPPWFSKVWSPGDGHGSASHLLQLDFSTVILNQKQLNKRDCELLHTKIIKTPSRDVYTEFLLVNIHRSHLYWNFSTLPTIIIMKRKSHFIRSFSLSWPLTSVICLGAKRRRWGSAQRN